ncbi:hypothetical protein B2H94_08155 [Clostridium sporogenes]|uniref:Uncharacterized protein n=5 Tax=Clostridium TaxID=1485 RepID=A0AAE4YZ80_CLOSG|nr:MULTISPECIES: hypothetical protein [Clostridium]MBE6075825.1 hypothetical protein [Clostridium lundense]MDU2831431.1 hypothetical protein [Clostridium botulinum]EDU36833.1 hypothetical protein CLOSPO_03002 [Clostridium sporogenes ATCC 15579]KIS23917.1 hypothetical protein N495_10030 [Clostridium botulinum B2 450]MDU4545836.1 hypothetical protein [Clostridium botulinum]
MNEYESREHYERNRMDEEELREYYKRNRIEKYYNKKHLKCTVTAYAYNENKNILIAPNTNTPNNSENEDCLNSAKENLDNLIKNFIDDNKDSETENKAVGKANIVNTNLNFIISI